MSESEPQTPHAKVRVILFSFGCGGLSVGFALAQQKGWLDWVPDPVVGLLIVLPLLALIYYLWTHEGVKKRRYLIYTHPVMSLIILIAIGASIGGGVGFIAWWTTFRQGNPSTSSAKTSDTEASKEANSESSANDATTNKHEEQGFNVSFKTELIDTTRNLDNAWLWLLYESGYGQTISPVSLVAFIEITNRHPYPVSISSYSMSINSDPCGWLYLSPIDMRGRQLLWDATPTGAKPLSHLHLIDTTTALSNQWQNPISAYGTQFGMLIFDTKVACPIQTGTPIQFRLEITDSTGATHSFESPLTVVQKTLTSGTSIGRVKLANFEMLGYNIDASMAYRRMFSEPMPDAIPAQEKKGIVVTQIPKVGMIVLDDGAYSLIKTPTPPQ
jgi:hypothetical protein